MAAITDRQVERAIATSAAAVSETPVPAGTFTDLTTSNATGRQTILGSTVPAYGANLAGPTASGTPLSNPTYVPTPSSTSTPVYDASGNVIGTNTITYNWDGSANPPVYTASASSALTSTQQDAYSMVKSTVAQWFGGNPAWVAAATDFLNKEIAGNNGADTILYDFRQQDFYKARFSGNTARAANGLNVLTEADYISLENKYSTLFESYGVGTSSATNLSTQSQFATLIGNDISPTELNSRLDLAVNQVQQADPTVLNTLKQYYPTISNSDLVGYFLAPSQALPALQRQVQTADIGAAAAQQGLSDTLARAGQLAAYGVTYDQAQAGYGKIAENLPASQKLSGIYGNQTGINYDQTTAENQYLMNSGAAALEQQKLADLEKQQFSGRSGVVGASAAAGYSGSLGKSIQGQF